MNLLNGLIAQKDIARELNINIRTIIRWRKERDFPKPHKIGGRNYYQVSEVAAWIKTQGA